MFRSRALLHESGAGTGATRTEPMRAILLAGATKEEFPLWSHTPTQPLDTTFGAGELNVLNSYLIQAGGEFNGTVLAPGSSVGDFGWDYGSIDGTNDLHYQFDVPNGRTARELSIVLAWNVDVVDTDPGAQFVPSHTLANLDLVFADATGGIIATSASTIDNVEHIYLTDLPAGTYQLRVSSDRARDFGLAWRTPSIPEPSSVGLVACAIWAVLGRFARGRWK